MWRESVGAGGKSPGQSQVLRVSHPDHHRISNSFVSQTHFRAAFAYLGLALHHLKKSEACYRKDNKIGTSEALETTFKNFKIESKSLAKAELPSSFGRVSPDIFLQIFSHVDSSLLISSTRVSRSWSEAIQGCTELFFNFEMEGKGQNICKGLEFFNSKSNNSI